MNNTVRSWLIKSILKQKEAHTEYFDCKSQGQVFSQCLCFTTDIASRHMRIHVHTNSLEGGHHLIKIMITIILIVIIKVFPASNVKCNGGSSN